MSGERKTGAGEEPSPSGPSAGESGYRRDDYWRQLQQDLPPDTPSEPDNGNVFETPQQRAGRDDDENSGAADEGKSESAEASRG